MDEKSKILNGHHRFERGQYLPAPYEHQEWPKWVNGQLVKSAEEMQELNAPSMPQMSPVRETEGTAMVRRGPGRPRKSE